MKLSEAVDVVRVGGGGVDAIGMDVRFGGGNAAGVVDLDPGPEPKPGPSGLDVVGPMAGRVGGGGLLGNRGGDGDRVLGPCGVETKSPKSPNESSASLS